MFPENVSRIIYKPLIYNNNDSVDLHEQCLSLQIRASSKFLADTVSSKFYQIMKHVYYIQFYIRFIQYIIYCIYQTSMPKYFTF